jgi:hypothetical protein
MDGGLRKRFRGPDAGPCHAARLGGSEPSPQLAPSRAFEPAAADAHPLTPKAVEYQCALCAEAYPSTATLNPWWALTRELCPKCNQLQIPRIDIAEPANQLEYHPALVRATQAEGGGGGDDDDDGGGGGGGSGLLDHQGGHGGGSFDGSSGGLGLGDGADAEGLEEVDAADDPEGPHRLPPDQAAKLLVRGKKESERERASASWQGTGLGNASRPCVSQRSSPAVAEERAQSASRPTFCRLAGP